MKIKKSRQIIFETREIRRIHIIRPPDESTLAAAPEITSDPLLMKRRGGFKALWREKLRGFWKLNRRRPKDEIQKSEVSLPETGKPE